MRTSVGLLVKPGFVPSSIGTVAQWYDATTMGLSDGTAVGTWSDLSGNGRDLTQSTAGAKPTFKTGIFGSLPCVRGDGGDCLSVSPTSWLSVANVTFAAVFRASSGQANKYWISAASASDGSNGFDVHFSASGTISSYLRTSAQAAAILTQTVTYNDGRTSVVVVDFQQGDTSAEHGLQVSNGRTDESTRVTNNKTDGATVVASNSFNLFNLHPAFLSFGAQVDIGEVLVYTSALTQANRTSLRLYLANKWGTV